jgi:hypothetical protein
VVDVVVVVVAVAAVAPAVVVVVAGAGTAATAAAVAAVTASATTAVVVVVIVVMVVVVVILYVRHPCLYIVSQNCIYSVSVTFSSRKIICKLLVSALASSCHEAIYKNKDTEHSLEITNKMQPCNRIYYSNVY